jgi:hypothetical protein
MCNMSSQFALNFLIHVWRQLHPRWYCEGMGYIYFSPLALQPNSGLGRLHETFRFTSVTVSRTVGRTPWTGDQLVAIHRHTKKLTHNTIAKHPCQEWDSNPRSRLPRSAGYIVTLTKSIIVVNCNAKHIFPCWSCFSFWTFRRQVLPSSSESNCIVRVSLQRSLSTVPIVSDKAPPHSSLCGLFETEIYTETHPSPTLATSFHI